MSQPHTIISATAPQYVAPKFLVLSLALENALKKPFTRSGSEEGSSDDHDGAYFFGEPIQQIRATDDAHSGWVPSGSGPDAAKSETTFSIVLKLEPETISEPIAGKIDFPKFVNFDEKTILEIQEALLKLEGPESCVGTTKDDRTREYRTDWLIGRSTLKCTQDDHTERILPMQLTMRRTDKLTFADDPSAVDDLQSAREQHCAASLSTAGPFTVLPRSGLGRQVDMRTAASKSLDEQLRTELTVCATADPDLPTRFCTHFKGVFHNLTIGNPGEIRTICYLKEAKAGSFIKMTERYQTSTSLDIRSSTKVPPTGGYMLSNDSQQAVLEWLRAEFDADAIKNGNDGSSCEAVWKITDRRLSIVPAHPVPTGTQQGIEIEVVCNVTAVPLDSASSA